MSACCSEPAGGDGAAIEALWQELSLRGVLPEAAVPVRTRLVRAVGRVALPSGPAFLKVMTFPRWGDRLRYLLRAMPAAREAAMLRRIRQVGIPCPDVLAVRTARRAGWPHRSMLVLRALPVVDEAAAAEQRLHDRAAIAQRLAAGGLLHPDLNPDNFLRLADGRLALLDVQSLRGTTLRRRSARAMAARLLLEATGLEPSAAIAVLATAGLCAADDRDLLPAAARIAIRWLRTRVRRCWRTSTEFECHRVRPGVYEHRRRGRVEPGRWVAGGWELARCWEGQRLLEVLEQRRPQLLAVRRTSWWRGGDWAVYVPASLPEERVREELRATVEGHDRLREQLSGRVAAGAVLAMWRGLWSGEARR